MNEYPCICDISQKEPLQARYVFRGPFIFQMKTMFFFSCLFVFLAFSSTRNLDLFEYKNAVACSFTCWLSWSCKAAIPCNDLCLPCGSDYSWSLSKSSHLGAQPCLEFVTLWSCGINHFRGQLGSRPPSSLCLPFASRLLPFR